MKEVCIVQPAVVSKKRAGVNAMLLYFNWGIFLNFTKLKMYRKTSFASLLSHIYSKSINFVMC